mmetsp:Transcript_4275/g.11144  ORF Transcript_4275/g.11144 Transcript_4275/m.11144 type:complete len:392 (+) Transcript_4275:2114-3289(+)
MAAHRAVDSRPRRLLRPPLSRRLLAGGGRLPAHKARGSCSTLPARQGMRPRAGRAVQPHLPTGAAQLHLVAAHDASRADPSARRGDLLPQGDRGAGRPRRHRPRLLPLRRLRVAPGLWHGALFRRAGVRKLDRILRAAHLPLHVCHVRHRHRQGAPPPLQHRLGQVQMVLRRLLDVRALAQAVDRRVGAALVALARVLALLARADRPVDPRQAHRSPAWQGGGRPHRGVLADARRARAQAASALAAQVPVQVGAVSLPALPGDLQDGVASVHHLVLTRGASLLRAHPLPARHGLDVRAQDGAHAGREDQGGTGRRAREAQEARGGGGGRGHQARSLQERCQGQARGHPACPPRPQGPRRQQRRRARVAASRRRGACGWYRRLVQQSLRRRK